MTERDEQRGDPEIGVCHVCKQEFDTQLALSEHLMDVHEEDVLRDPADQLGQADQGQATSAVEKLETYLNDHLTGSIVALDVARRRGSAQGDDEIGVFLRTFVHEAERDQRTLRSVMETSGTSPRVSRELLGTATSWLDSIRGTLKMPGAPNLVRDIELLIMGVRGKELLWKSVERVGVTTDPPLQELQARARDQIAGLEELHARATGLEFGSA
jgi:hypothetical protein